MLHSRLLIIRQSFRYAHGPAARAFGVPAAKGPTGWCPRRGSKMQRIRSSRRQDAHPNKKRTVHRQANRKPLDSQRGPGLQATKRPQASSGRSQSGADDSSPKGAALHVILSKEKRKTRLNLSKVLASPCELVVGHRARFESFCVMKLTQERCSSSNDRAAWPCAFSWLLYT